MQTSLASPYRTKQKRTLRWRRASSQRYPGQMFDAESGLHYNLNRDYEPGGGRYVQSDPIGLEGGISTYAYVNSQPLTQIDPEGLNASAATFPGSGTATRAPIRLPSVGSLGRTVAGRAGLYGASFAGGYWLGSKIYENNDLAIGNAIDAVCGSDPDFCYNRWQAESGKCVIWGSLGKRWVAACRDRARYRFQMCMSNGGTPHPGEPPEWIPSNDYPH